MVSRATSSGSRSASLPIRGFWYQLSNGCAFSARTGVQRIASSPTVCYNILHARATRLQGCLQPRGRRHVGLAAKPWLRRRNWALVVVFALTMFLSASLLFLVQPMFARMVLPLLGGTPQVWTTAIVFYQVVLLVGYLYAHLVPSRMGVRRHAALHVLLLLVPFLLLPISLPAGWMPPTEANPIPWLLAFLLVAVGPPFFVLSATSPLLQLWFSRSGHPAAHDPYFLYAASNVGSMLALLSYPLLLEPTLRVVEQSNLWAVGYGILVAFMLVCAFLVWRSRAPALHTFQHARAVLVIHGTGIAATRRLRWVLWAFVPSSLMLSVTTYLSTDIAAVPLLWIIPLTLYLLSFVFAFARKPILRHGIVMRAFRLLFLMLLYMFFLGATHLWLAPFHLITFFAIAWASHSALAHDRPQPSHLTEFYLWIAVGGALGGIFNSVLAPILFTSVPEYRLVLALAVLSHLRRQDISSDPWVRRLDVGLPVALGLVTVAVLVALQAAGVGTDLRIRAAAFVLLPIIVLRLSRRRLRFGLAVTALLLISFLVRVPDLWGASRIEHAERGFFGVHRVESWDRDGERYHALVHGSTLHGMQALEPTRQREPLTYYHHTGPIGQLFSEMQGDQRLQQVAVVGLGAGSLACYSQPGQQWTFYEIDPLVVKTAQDPRFFTFLRDCAPTAKIVLGDGRLSLTREGDQQFDLIVLDAFSSDSIPMHLVSRESLALYLQKLAPHGLLAYHISNRHVNIRPVLANLALDGGLESLAQFDAASAEEAALGKAASDWVLMAREAGDFGALASDSRWRTLEGQPGDDVWTDDFSSIISVLRFR